MSDEKSLAIVPRTVDEVTALATKIAASKLLPEAPQNKIPDVLMTMMAGQELGFAPMTALRLIHVFGGKPILSADGMVALCLSSGKCVYFERVEESDTSVTYETLRVGAKAPRRCTWTMAMAKTAALTSKDNWRTFPRAMLSSRAKAELARDVYPDVLAGVYTEDELERPVSSPPPNPQREPDAVDAEIVSPIDTQALLDRLAAADTLETVEAIRPELLKLEGDVRKTAQAMYRTKMKKFEEDAKAAATETAA